MDQLLRALLRRAQLVALPLGFFDEGKLRCGFFGPSHDYGADVIHQMSRTVFNRRTSVA
jgi:hypothetical protein